MANKVNDNIRKIQQKKGISKDRFSKKANLDFHTIARIESGAMPNPRIEKLIKNAKALCVGVDDLIKK